jgi:alpha-D-ribose 1-methylphosphonate 5-triphosphate synthase subunit PhnG
MGILAHAGTAEIETLLRNGPALPHHTLIRGPEVGLVMARGRAGGAGAPFNFGEIAITRCSVRLSTGQVGHSYVVGRDKRHAELSAILDAVLQNEGQEEVFMRSVIDPLLAAQTSKRENDARKAAATRVQFFTMAVMR